MSCTDPGLSVYLDQPVGQGKTGLISGYLVDEAGDDLALLDVATLTVTLTDYTTGVVIHSRSAQNIKNTNGGSLAEVAVDGVTRLQFKFLLSALDNVILDADLTREAHVAAFTWGYDTDRIGGLTCLFVVEAM